MTNHISNQLNQIFQQMASASATTGSGPSASASPPVDELGHAPIGGACPEPVEGACPECGSADVHHWLHAFYPPGHERAGIGYVYPCPNAWHIARRAHQSRLDGQIGLAGAGSLMAAEYNFTLDHIFDRGAGSRTMINAARQMLAAPFGILTLWGGSGNGKTRILQAITNELRLRGVSDAIYFTTTDLSIWLRRGIKPRDGEPDMDERIERIARVTWLAIDEFEKIKASEWANNTLSAIVDIRYRLGRGMDGPKRGTALAMNCNPETLPPHIISRLRFDMNGPDGFKIIYNADSDARISGL